MSDDTRFDMPFSDIQEEIMKNLPNVKIPGSQPELKQYPLKPYARPSPQELFKLSEEDEMAFNDLRLKLGFCGDESATAKQTTPEKTNELELRNSSSGGDKPRIQIPIRPVAAYTPRFRNHEDMYDKPIPARTVLKTRHDPKLSRMVAYLDNVIVSQEKLNTVFDLPEEGSKIGNQRPKDSYIVDYVENSAERYCNEFEHSPRHPRIQRSTIVLTSPKKTVVCDLRDSHPEWVIEAKAKIDSLNRSACCTSKDSDEDEGETELWIKRYREQKRNQTNKFNQHKLHDRQEFMNFRNENSNYYSRRISNFTCTEKWNKESQKYLEDMRFCEIYTEKRRNECRELLKMAGIVNKREVLVHEEVSFTPQIPLLEPSVHPSVQTRYIHLKFRPIPAQKFGFFRPIVYGNHSTNRSHQKFHPEEYSLTCFAFLSWLISLVVQPDDSEEEQLSKSLQTVGLYVTSTHQGGTIEGIPITSEPTAHCIIQTTLEESDEAKALIENAFAEDASFWEAQEEFIWNPHPTRLLCNIEKLDQLNEFDASYASAEEWNLFAPDKMPNIFYGVYGNADQCTVPINARNDRSVEKDDESQVYWRLEEHTDSDSATIVFELDLDMLTRAEVKGALFMLLASCHLKHLDLVNIRIGWITTRVFSCYKCVPHVAVAVRGQRSWLYAETMCAWISDNMRNVNENKLSCSGNRFLDINRKYLSRWFGPRLPDVTSSYSGQLAEGRRLICELVSRPNDCWLTRPVASDVMLILDDRLLMLLGYILNVASDICGYQPVFVGGCCLNEILDKRCEDFEFFEYNIELDETDCAINICQSQTLDIFKNELPKFSIILRREHAQLHLIRFLLCLRTRWSVDLLNMDATRLLENGGITVVYPKQTFSGSYNFNQIFKFELEKYFTETDTNHPEQPGCCQLGFVLVSAESDIKVISKCPTTGRPKKMTTTPTSQLSLVLNEILRFNKRRRKKQLAEADVLSINWIPEADVGPDFVDNIRALCGAPNFLKEFNHPTERIPNLGLILIHGQHLSKCLSIFNGLDWIAFTLKREPVRKFIQTFFTHVEITTNVAYAMNHYRDRSCVSNEIWTTVHENRFCKCQEEEICISIPWPENSSYTVWLTHLMSLLRMLSIDDFIIHELYTTDMGETKLRVVRTNATLRVAYLNEHMSRPKLTEAITWWKRQTASSSSDDSSDEDWTIWRMRCPRGEWTPLLINDSTTEKTIGFDQASKEFNISGDRKPQLFDEHLGSWSQSDLEFNAILHQHLSEAPSENGRKPSRDRLRILDLFNRNKLVVCGILCRFLDMKSVTELQRFDFRNRHGFEIRERGFYDIFLVIRTINCPDIQTILDSKLISGKVPLECLYVAGKTTPIVELFQLLKNCMLPHCRL